MAVTCRLLHLLLSAILRSFPSNVLTHFVRGHFPFEREKIDHAGLRLSLNRSQYGGCLMHKPKSYHFRQVISKQVYVGWLLNQTLYRRGLTPPTLSTTLFPKVY